MEKMKKQRKGFTLTELAIVIAVIAILIAVLVPTFVSLINKAQESSDKQLVKNLNTALSVEEATDGQPETMSEAIAIAEDNGYNVANLNPTSSGYNIMWDQESNRFFLVDENEEVVYSDSSTGLTEGEKITAIYTYWRIVESESDYTNDNKGYSLYVTTEIEVDGALGGVEYAEGVTSTKTVVNANTTQSSASAGNKTLASAAIKTASGMGSVAPVIIKTNGGTLSVSVTGDAEAKHYGTAETVSVSSGSYVSYATVTANVEIASDSVSVTITASSEVSAIYVTADKSESISITISSTNEISVGASDSTVAGNLNKIVTSTSSSTTTVVTTVCNDVALLYFAAGDGTSEHPYEIATATQLANIGNLSDTMVTITTDEDGKSTYTYTYIYFKLTADIVYDYTFGEGGITYFFNGELDGNNKSITVNTDMQNIETGYGEYWFAYTPYDAIIKDLTVYQNKNISLVYGWYFAASKIKFDNVNMGDESCKGTSIEMFRNSSGYINYFSGKEITFNNCTNYYSLYSNKSEVLSAVFIGAYCRTDSNPTVTFTNCKNYGNVTGAYAGLYFGNDYNAANTVNSNNLTVTNCVNEGIITYWINGGYTAYYSSFSEISTNDKNYTEDVAARQATAKIMEDGTTGSGSIVGSVDDTLKLTADSSTKALTLTKASNENVIKYTLVYSGYANWTNANGGSGTQYIAVEIELTPDFGSGTTWAVSNNYNLTKKGINLYDKDSYISAIDGKSESNWTEGLTKITISNIDSDKATGWYDSTNNCIVVDFSNMREGFTYTAKPGDSSNTSCKVVAYNKDNEIVALKLVG